MKVTTEKLPKSLVAIDIELNRDQVEKGLDRAARRLSQKYNIPGFRKGKAPRFIIENYFGRDTLMEEASEDLINKAYKEALTQTAINPVGQASLESVNSAEPFRFRVTVPVPPTVTVGDYRSIRIPLTIDPVTDETVEFALNSLRDKHVVLKELEEPRPIQQSDQISVRLESFVDGESLEKTEGDEEIPPTTLVVEPDRLITELYNGFLNSNVDDQIEISAQMPDDHANETVRGKQVTFKAHILSVQERLLPEWDELPVLEEFDGTLEELRTKTNTELEESARTMAERQVIDGFIDQLVEQTEYDIPDVIIREQAEALLHDQEQEFAKYGITLEQMLEYRGTTHDKAVEELLPEAERQVKVTLALQSVVRDEQLNISNREVEIEVQRIVQTYKEEERDNITQLLSNQLRRNIAGIALDRKLRSRLLDIAAGTAPELGDLAQNNQIEIVTTADHIEPAEAHPEPNESAPASDVTAVPAS